jgi:hypothetical protein
MSLVIAAAARSVRGAQSSCWLALGWFASLVVEYKRAIAAEQRYHALKRASPPIVASSGTAAPRRIFEDLYSSTADDTARSDGASGRVRMPATEVSLPAACATPRRVRGRRVT